MAHQHYPWRSKTEKEVPPGFKFTPTEEQLIDHYLIPQALGMPIPGDHVVEEKVYEKAPWELLGPHRDNRYLFTTRTMHGNRVKRTVGAKGTWSVTASGIPIQSADGKIIGLKTKLSYCVVNKKSTGYTMDEYKLTPQSVTSSYMPEEEAPSQELVLCCVRRVQRGDSKKRQAEEEAAVAVVSSKQAYHDGASEIGGEYYVCKRRVVPVAAAGSITFSPENAAAVGSVTLSRKSSVAVGINAANCSARPCSIYDADCSSMPPMHLPAAAEASPEGRAQTEAINSASAKQIMPSSAVDQQLPPCNDSDLMEDLSTDFPPLTAGVGASAAADCSATPSIYHPAAAEASLEGRAPTEDINYASTDQTMSSSAIDQQLPPCSDNCWMEMFNNDILYPSEAYELDMIPAEVVATAEHHLSPLSSQGGDQPTTSAIYFGDLCWVELSNSRYLPPLPAFNCEPSLHTDSPLLCSDDLWEPLILKSPPESALAGVAASAAAINLQPLAYNNGYRMEEMINGDIFDTCEGYETAAEVATTSEHH